jgi:hypothetical protein
MSPILLPRRRLLSKLLPKSRKGTLRQLPIDCLLFKRIRLAKQLSVELEQLRRNKMKQLTKNKQKQEIEVLGRKENKKGLLPCQPETQTRNFGKVYVREMKFLK